MKFDTALVHFDAAPGDPHRPVSTPISQTATFAQETALELGPYDYSRSGNPTRGVLERQLAVLENGTRGFAFASGMSALTAVLRLVPAGGHVVAGDDLYGGTCRLLTTVLARHGVSVTYADLSHAGTLDRALTSDTALVLFETPTNPLERIIDIRAVAERAHARGVRVAVDNTLLSPCLQRPLERGADVVIHSATKALSGHSDLMAGAVIVRDARLADEIAFLQNAEGTALGPFESWLLLRGMKTLSLRIERQEANARKVAAYLATQPLVTRIHRAGLSGSRGAAVHAQQASGSGGVLSFETGSVEISRLVAERTRLFTIAVSFSGVGSSISLPCRMSHASVPPSVKRAGRLPEDLVRLSVGIEDAEDLIADLAAAFEAAASEAPRSRESVGKEAFRG
ncbi:MAG: PLP-dependent transferase [Thermoanaerobaculia bacterium]